MVEASNPGSSGGSRADAPDVTGKQNRMDDFYRELESKKMDALWRGRASASSSGKWSAPYSPCRWRWSDIRPFLDRAGKLVEPGPDAERRVVQLINPTLPGIRSASHTLTANVQMVLPGETAPSHRHTNSAIRFIIEGSAAVTIVNGEPVEMNPGDLVLTPGMAWHGHISDSSGPSIWMDTLDRPLVASLKQVFQEGLESTNILESITKPMGGTRARFGNAHMRPVAMRTASPVSPLFSYPWAETREALHRLSKVEADPFDDVAFDYVNPSTGGHVLPTIGCRIQLLRSRVHTRAHRHSYASVYHVFRGSGATVADGVQIGWKQGDFFVLPPQCWHEHINSESEEAILFSTTDAPVLEVLQLNREEALSENQGHQIATTTYEEMWGP